MPAFYFVGGPLNGETRDLEDDVLVYRVPMMDEPPQLTTIHDSTDVTFQVATYHRRTVAHGPERHDVFEYQEEGAPWTAPPVRPHAYVNGFSGKVRPATTFRDSAAGFGDQSNTPFLAGGRTVGRTPVPRPYGGEPSLVSTVFLGIDHAFGGRPVLFETMVFDCPAVTAEIDDYQERSHTYAEAVVEHEKAVQLVERANGVRRFPDPEPKARLGRLVEEAIAADLPVVPEDYRPVTEEEGWLVKLAANPDDATTRLVFADWLQERDDPRADGHRAIARQGLKPRAGDKFFTWFNADCYLPSPTFGGCPVIGAACVSPEWLAAAIKHGPARNTQADLWGVTWWVDWFTRSQAEEALVVGFPHLPEDVRARLLTPRESPEDAPGATNGAGGGESGTPDPKIATVRSRTPKKRSGRTR